MLITLQALFVPHTNKKANIIRIILKWNDRRVDDKESNTPSQHRKCPLFILKFNQLPRKTIPINIKFERIFQHFIAHFLFLLLISDGFKLPTVYFESAIPEQKWQYHL